MSTTTDTDIRRNDDDEYKAFLESIRARFAGVTGGAPPLFTTTATGLFEAFLSALPEDRRQHYTCSACRRFIVRFGGLVTISPDGAQTSVLWEPEAASPACSPGAVIRGTVQEGQCKTPMFFRDAVCAMRLVVNRACVDGVFLCEETIWGTPSNHSSKVPGIWYHMAVTPGAELVFKPSAIQTTAQVIAEKVQDFGTLSRGLAEFPVGIVQQAQALLTSGNLYRSEKCVGVAKWLFDLHEARGKAKATGAHDNLTWLAVASAPAGFCHVRSGMIGTLLEDIEAGLAFADIKAKFDSKMNPLVYQRPQAAPTAGNIAQAEAIVEKLGIRRSLERRFARIEEVQALWKPTPTKGTPPAEGSVFGHLKPKGKAPTPQIDQPTVTMTWDKFRRTILPGAETIEFYVPEKREAYVALVTAVDLEAPPILQWDREGKRNPVSLYVYVGGSQGSEWNLTEGAFVAVTAIALKPSMWDDENGFAHQGKTVLFLLSGAKDLKYVNGFGAGSCLFPEFLKSELHGIRATIEAHSKTAGLAGAKEATACGISLSAGNTSWDHVFRATSKGVKTSYKLDRWD